MRTMSGGICPHYDCANRNSFGYCKTTACINPKYSNIGTAQYGQGVQKRITTNADRIRAMTDEELARILAEGCHGTIECPNCCGEYTGTIKSCTECWLDWLKEEVEK